MKKLLSLVLAVVMVLGLTTVALAATDSVYLDGSKWSFRLKGTGPSVTESDFVGDQSAGAEIDYYIEFNSAFVTKAMKPDFAVTLKKTTGGAAFDTAAIKYDSNKAAYYVRLTLADPYAATKSLDWEATLSFTAEGKRVKDGSKTLEFAISGTITNGDTQKITADDDTVWVEDGNIIEGEEYNKNLEIVLNDDISLFARIFASKKYYAAIKEEPDDAAVAILNKYTDITNYAELKTIGLSTADVKFGYTDNMYAYTTDEDGDLVYVGRTNATLPYHDRYFISAKELVLPAAEVEEPVAEPTPAPVEPEETESASGGGDVVAPTQTSNYNPGTGR